MSQITKQFCNDMLANAAREEHSPLTVWEERQLARAWLELQEIKQSHATAWARMSDIVKTLNGAAMTSEEINRELEAACVIEKATR